jgi:hypothetical protein
MLRAARVVHARSGLAVMPADLAAQHGVLVPERQQFGILGHAVPCQHHQTAEQAAYKQVEDGNDHSAMIPAGKPDQARSSNRAPQDCRVRAPEQTRSKHGDKTDKKK